MAFVMMKSNDSGNDHFVVVFVIAIVVVVVVVVGVAGVVIVVVVVHTMMMTATICFPYTFIQLPGTVKALDSIRANRNKFICLNDNLGDNDVFMHDFLAKFYEAMLPLPSPFELPPGQSNFYLRLDVCFVMCDD